MTRHGQIDVDQKTCVGIDRRAALGGLAAAAVALVSTPARAGARAGAVDAAEGDVFAKLEAARRLGVRSEVLLGDLVWTEARSRAALALDGGTKLHLGPQTRLTIDRFVAAKGGELRIGGGALLFDRDDALPKLDIEVRSVFGLIGVRGTRFFAGPSRGVFGVFVARGEVAVTAAGVTRAVRSGEGVDIARPGAAPSETARWKQPRINEAMASVLDGARN